MVNYSEFSLVGRKRPGVRSIFLSLAACVVLIIVLKYVLRCLLLDGSQIKIYIQEVDGVEESDSTF